ncbi:uncharacterized protein morgue [Prorops nasuta]|uniref:uncharacterized protein morgue n=1 Tax=Prorops nasuta TaxID=863751 RepID=UPI0034CE4272
MAGDRIVSGTQFENADKMNDISDCNFNLNLDDEYDDPAQFVECPEFQFSAMSCYFCNGYYGPCFEEPVCATCHAFLFPDDIGVVQVPIFSEKTDDEDSGNDEPNDLFYNHERRTSQQQQNSPQNNIPNIQNPPNIRIPNIYICQPPCVQLPNVPEARDYIPGAQNNVNMNDLFDVQVQRALDDNQRENQHNGDAQNLPYNLDEFVREDVQNLEELQPADSVNSENNEQQQLNCRLYENVGESSRSNNLQERLEILINHKHIEHEAINEPELVERLPAEVLLAVFSHLDDVSLWSAANVCRRWCGLLSTHITSQQWKQRVKLRWPLYRPIGHVKDWYNIYDQLASSAPCRTCLAQMCLQSRPPRMEENSWRRNRLRTELKSLRSDPPEGIEATPLDQMCFHWQATITGPVGSPYEGGLFYLYLQVPYSYPMYPPVVRFLTKILHPNVSRHGDVGIDSIHHNWSLALTISKVLISVQSLLTDPYCQVCMEPELGEMYMTNREKFEEIARAWTWKYAMHDVVTPS